MLGLKSMNLIAVIGNCNQAFQAFVVYVSMVCTTPAQSHNTPF